MYTSNILQFCELYLNKTRKKKKKIHGAVWTSAGSR